MYAKFVLKHTVNARFKGNCYVIWKNVNRRALVRLRAEEYAPSAKQFCKNWLALTYMQTTKNLIKNQCAYIHMCIHIHICIYLYMYYVIIDKHIFFLLIYAYVCMHKLNEKPQICKCICLFDANSLIY